MSRKFLFCFPLRIGNFVFGFILIIFCIAVAAYNLYKLGCTLKSETGFEDDTKFRNWQHLDNIVGGSKDTVILIVTMLYYSTYIAIALLLFLFAIFYTIGVYKANHCLVSSFFVYSFFHLFFTVVLLVWEATSGGYIQIGLIALFDVILLICLFGVKYFMEAITTGYIYSRPGKVYH